MTKSLGRASERLEKYILIDILDVSERERLVPRWRESIQSANTRIKLLAQGRDGHVRVQSVKRRAIFNSDMCLTNLYVKHKILFLTLHLHIIPILHQIHFGLIHFQELF